MVDVPTRSTHALKVNKCVCLYQITRHFPEEVRLQPDKGLNTQLITEVLWKVSAMSTTLIAVMAYHRGLCMFKLVKLYVHIK